MKPQNMDKNITSFIDVGEPCERFVTDFRQVMLFKLDSRAISLKWSHVIASLPLFGGVTKESASASMIPSTPIFIAVVSLLASELHKAMVQFDVSELVRRSQAGDQQAVGLLYEAFAQRIYRYIMYRVGNPKDAEDLTAEVFVAMVEGLPAYQLTEAPFAAWLFRIAASRVADHFRRLTRHTEVDLPEMMADHTELPEDIIVKHQSFDILRRALDQLTEEQRNILILRFVERRSHEDVAVLLNKSVSAVKSAQHRALLRLTDLLGSNQKSRHYLRGSE